MEHYLSKLEEEIKQALSKLDSDGANLFFEILSKKVKELNEQTIIQENIGASR